MLRPQEPEPEQPLSLAIRNARQAVLRVLDEHRVTGMWVSDLLDRVFRESNLPAGERGLAMELACGVVRRQATLDAILKTLIARPVDQVEPALWTILRIGVYQIVMLDGIPPHAAVHETVELCKRVGRIRWCGFVNGVLRGATRLATDQFDDQPSASSVPVGRGRHRKLAKPVFFEPNHDMAAYAAGAFSFPIWLIERWLKRFEASELLRICEWFNSPPPLVIRPNELRATPDALRESFTAAGIETVAIDESGSLTIDGGVRIDKLPGYDQGWFVVQDYSASRAALRLAPQPGQRVWDVCAAPGGKTCHLAAMMRNEGQILATDIRSDRLEIVDQNTQRMGVSIVQTKLIDEQGFRLPPGPFDAILVDVPCSNTGVLFKRPEARWRITPDGLRELSHVQANLLGWSLERLAPGGRLVYSTCSIEPSENELIVRQVLDNFPAARLVEEEQFVPGRPADGAYQALIVKK